ncbi:MAG: hydantoinase/oxoprolinase family protein, partial [Thermodesulfovibrionales bacterium]
MNTEQGKWRFAVDRGGTFTDVVGIDPAGEYHFLKLLSRSPEYDDASIEGIRRMIGLRPGGKLPGEEIRGIRFGTTVATNALLERKGCRVGLLISAGFRDLLDIGYQSRPDIFSLCIRKPNPLYRDLIEVDERTDRDGRILRNLDEARLSLDLEGFRKSGIEAVAVVLMHSWRNPAHELKCAEILKDQGFSAVFLSHRTSNLIKIVGRGQSTLVDAYLSLALTEYLEGIKKQTGDIPLAFMQSSGGLCPPEAFSGRRAILSGPAGGVIAVSRIAEEAGIRGVVGFDMGGTSTDVCRFDGRLERICEKTVEGIPLQTEMLNIVTVAAGGGSILGFDGAKMTVGPESAGSFPGPACYGFGGPLTVTDANLLTGRIIPEQFPATFGPDRNSPLDASCTRERFRALADAINRSLGTGLSPEEAAMGFLRIANERMAMAIKEISVSRGVDIRDYALLCFGGAGGQHACSLATLLEMDQVVIHPLGSVMSAYGIGLAEPATREARTILTPFTREGHAELEGIFAELEAGMGGRHGECRVRREIDLRPTGTESFITVAYGGFDETIGEFMEQYRRLFGISPEAVRLETVNARIEMEEQTGFFHPYHKRRREDSAAPRPVGRQRLFCNDGPVDAPVYLREDLPAHAKIQGPALIIDRSTTIVVDPSFEAEIANTGIMTMRRVSQESAALAVRSEKADPVLLEVFNNLFMATATEMGTTLQNTSHSVNMKERLDFSCAVFDAEGNLVANAPHIPVHLGAMSDTVRAIVEEKGDSLKPGDIYLSNNPYRGGSHLPDMTVVCPVFTEAGRLIFFTAARGHHSDVGGTTPGSMPPSASHISEEGVLVDNLLLVREGVFREEELRAILSGHRYPVRNITERIADFRAQIAACHKGMAELTGVISRYGLETVMAYMGFIQENAGQETRRMLLRLLKGKEEFHGRWEDYLDDGTIISA